MMRSVKTGSECKFPTASNVGSQSLLRVRILLWCILFAPTTLTAQSTRERAARSATPAHASSSWSPPQALGDIPDGKSIRSPFLSVHGDTVYVSANVFPINARAGLGNRAALLLRIAGTPIPLPPGDFVFGYPKGVIHQRGAYHLFWSESTESVAGPRLRIPTPTLIWHAAWQRGRWTQPERVMTARSLQWTADQGTPVVDSSGRLHVIVAGSLDGLHNSTLYVRMNGRRWELQRLPPAATYASITAWNGDTLVAAFVAADTSIKSGANNLFISVSTNGGKRWSRARLLESEGTNVATAPKFARGGHTLHLVWAQSLRGDGRPEVLRHRYSRTGGYSWLTAADAPLAREGQLGFVVAASACGATVALVESIAARDDRVRVVVDEVRWTGSAVQVSPLLPDAFVLASPAVLEINGKFHLIATSVGRQGEQASAVHLTRFACPS